MSGVSRKHLAKLYNSYSLTMYAYFLEFRDPVLPFSWEKGSTIHGIKMTCSRSTLHVHLILGLDSV